MIITELFCLAKQLFNKIDLSQGSKLIKMKYFPFDGYSYMSWCGNIIYKKDRYANINSISLRHETIHKFQAGKNYSRWYRYYLKYLWYWIIGNPFSRSSYYTIPFEIEAYANEDNLDYEVTKDSYKKYIIKDRKSTYNKNRKTWKQFIKTIVN